MTDINISGSAVPVYVTDQTDRKIRGGAATPVYVVNEFAAAGASAIDDLTDVTVTGTPADNELLAYDTGTGEWINQTAGEAGLGTGDVTAAAIITDNAVVRGDGGAKGVQSSGVTVDDSGNIEVPAGAYVRPATSVTGSLGLSSHVWNSIHGRLFSAEAQNAANPAYSFRADSDLGIYRIGANVLGFSSGGSPTAAFARLTSVNATPQTVIDNGTGDVTLVLSGTFTVSDGAGNVAGGVITATAPSGTFNLYDDGGTNTCQLQVAADGSVTVVRTAGARTYTVNLNLNWL